MHYGPAGTREHARKRHRDAEGNWVLPTFPDPEEQFREFPFEYPYEQTVGRIVTMPHFLKMVMEERVLQGCATFQLALDEDLPRKRGRPSKASGVAREPPRSVAGKCRCKTLFQNKQEDRSVAGYTVDFINQARLCKPKSAEMWCKWYKRGLRKKIQDKVKGVLEPLEFALVQRMAGLAIEAEGEIEAKKPGPGKPKKGDGNPKVTGGEVPKKKRGRPQKPSSDQDDCDCDVRVQAAQKSNKVRDYLWEFLDTARHCQPKPAEEWCRLFRAGLRKEIRDKLGAALEPLEFALVRRMASQAIAAEDKIKGRVFAVEQQHPRKKNGNPKVRVAGGGTAGTGIGTIGDSPRGGWLSE